MAEKKKLLLFGANQSLIKDFFSQLKYQFEMLSCSSIAVLLPVSRKQTAGCLTGEAL